MVPLVSGKLPFRLRRTILEDGVTVLYSAWYDYRKRFSVYFDSFVLPTGSMLFSMLFSKGHVLCIHDTITKILFGHC